MSCIRPVTQKNSKTNTNFRRACNQCTPCLITRRNKWTARILAENSFYSHSEFLTLTYKEDPGDLHYPDVQKFLKRMRKKHGKFRYFVVGEYGEKGGRAHWHLIMFGLRTGIKGLGELPQWKHGMVFVGTVTPASAAYVAGYALKKIGDPRPYYCNMSRSPGIGHEYAWEAGKLAAKREMGPELEAILYDQKRFYADKYMKRIYNLAYQLYGGTQSPQKLSALELESEWVEEMKSQILDNEIIRFRNDYRDRMKNYG